MKHPIHPGAAIYPMMSDDELQQLASSIKEYGQYHPIELTEWLQDSKAVKGIIDGRNREAACEIAGIQPEYKTLDFKRDDTAIRTYIFESNRLRRSLNAGQLAMSYAMIFPDRDSKGGRTEKNVKKNEAGTKNVKNSERSFSRARLSQARRILDHSREYAEAVMRGDMQFDTVLTAVTKEQKDRDNDIRKETEEMDQLREHAPHLVRDVELGNKGLAEATKEMKELIAAESRRRTGMFRAMHDLTGIIGTFANSDQIDNVPGWLENPDYMKEFTEIFPRGVVQFLERLDEEQLNTAVERVTELLRTLRKEVRSSIRVVE